MQAEKEDSTGVVKTIKKKMHDWWMSYERKLWTDCIFVYSGLFLLVIFVGSILFTKFNLFHTDVNSARYMLSALVQSQAAIVAIVITLTLVAVQLTASAYSPRVIDIFKKNPDMWILLSVYGFSIFYGFIVLKLVEGAEGEAVSQSVIWSLGRFSISFEFCVSLAYWLGAFTFVALFPYMWNIIGLLKSGNIIKRLATEITKDNILYRKEDPILPILDIIHGSIMKYDIETTRVGLGVVWRKVIEIIDSNSEKSISKLFCKHLNRVSGLAVNKMDDVSTSVVILTLQYFAENTAEKGFKFAPEKAAKSLGEVGITAAKNGFECATAQAVESLGYVRRTSAENNCEDATSKATKSLEEVGKAALEKGLEDATEQFARFLGEVGKAALDEGMAKGAARSLCEVGRAALEKGFEDAAEQAVLSLGEVGKAALEKGLEDAAEQAVLSLGEVGKAALEKGLEDVAEQAARSLGEVGKAAADEGLENAAEEAARSLGEVGKAAADEGLNKAAEEAARSLGEVGKAAADEGLKFMAIETTWSLGEVGRAAADKGLEKATEEAVRSLGEVGIAVMEKGLEPVTPEVVKYLGEVGRAAAEKDLDRATAAAAKSLAL
jgi:hypothetical protein